MLSTLEADSLPGATCDYAGNQLHRRSMEITMTEKNLSAKVAKIIVGLENQAKFARAAAGIASGDDYCDFFVENGGDGKPWHEKCPEDLVGIDLRAKQFSNARLSRIDQLRLRPSASDDYCDFFVENGGDGKPWHEKCPGTKVKDLLVNPARRAILISRSEVVKTLQRITER